MISTIWISNEQEKKSMINLSILSFNKIVTNLNKEFSLKRKKKKRFQKNKVLEVTYWV